MATVVLGFFSGEIAVQFRIEAATRVGRKFKRFSVSHQLQDISRAIEDGAAMCAIPEVCGHDGAELSVNLLVEIVRDVPPDFHAVDFDGPFGQVPTPFLC